jgi:TPR repeat protein
MSKGETKTEANDSILTTLLADQGHARAQCNLGIMYETGRGVEPDAKRALELYTLSADQGHARAQFNLGYMYEKGQGVEPDAKRALELYTLSADQGHARAQCKMSLSSTSEEDEGITDSEYTDFEDAVSPAEAVETKSESIEPVTQKISVHPDLFCLSIQEAKRNKVS